MMHGAEETEIRQNMEAQGLMSYNERLLEEYRNSSNEEHIVSPFLKICLSVTDAICDVRNFRGDKKFTLLGVKWGH